MALVANRHGKARVRIARVHRDGERHEFRELTVQAMVESDVGRSFTDGDNAGVVATDTIKNLTNLVARDHLQAEPEAFAQALAAELLGRYQQISRAVIICHETRWTRATIAGAPHAHTFVLDANGTGLAELDATRASFTLTSGITGFTLMKTTQSGWTGYVMDDVTTLPETTDRVLATAMDARWRWSAPPAECAAANAAILSAMLDAFATGYSRGVQDSMFRMAQAALHAFPGIDQVSLACPNKHYIPVNFAPFGRTADNSIFTPTDEPHGQIECTVDRS